MAGKKRSHGDGGLYRIRGGKLWRATYTYGTDPETGKPLRWEATARTQSAARDKLEDAKEEIRTYGAPIDKKTRVEEWANSWLETARADLDPKTAAGYASAIRQHIVPVIGQKRVSAVRPADISSVRAAIMDKGRATSTARHAHVVMGLIFEAARVNRICATNPVEDAPKPGGRRKAIVKATRGAFTTEQVVKLLEAASRMDTALGSRHWFKFMTGARQGEILGASLEDLNLDDGYYVVNWKLESIPRKHGCESPCGYKRGANCPDAIWDVPEDFEKMHLHGAWHLTRPKSRTGRVVPLIPQMVEALKRHIETDTGPNPHGLIWHDGEGSPIDPKDDAAQWRELLVAAGILTPEEAVPGGPMTGHWARHTAVTVLMELTRGDAQLVGEIVGHSSAEVTAMYRHARDSERDAAMAALEKAWLPVLEKS